MNIEDLEAEAGRLARAATKYAVAHGGTDGRWDASDAAAFKVATTTPSGRVVVVSETPDGRWRANEETGLPEGGEPLSASPWSCPAPIEAIFLLGGDDVGAWLAANNWQRTWGYNDNFPDSAVVREFERWWQGQHPLYSGDAVAVAGGWHFCWPDDDWWELIDDELVLWTVESEPYLEVWKAGRGLKVLRRIS